jgi:glutamyl-tRNA reductase
MHLVTIGLSYRTAPIELREKLAPHPGQIPALLHQLRDRGLSSESVLLSTCNRVELYTVPNPRIETDEIARWLLELGGLNQRSAMQHLYSYKEQDALRHLFRVISSLDSMVVGEPQIVAQVKEAYRIASEAKATGPVMNRVMDGALTVAKKIRSETDIAREAVSIGRAGVELARQVLGDLSRCSALLIGAGDHGKLVARNLCGYGLSELVITNRTFSRASNLAQLFGAAAVPMSDMERYLERVDIVLTSTGAGRALITKKMLGPVMRRRKYRPMVLIDLSVPRVIETGINDLDSVYRFDVDDLVQVADRGKKKRQDAAVAAEAIISQEAGRFWSRVLGETYNPLIGRIPRQAEQIRLAEMARASTVLDRLSETDRRAVDLMTRAIVKKILHRPVSHARQLAREGDSENLIRLLMAMSGDDDD